MKIKEVFMHQRLLFFLFTGLLVSCNDPIESEKEAIKAVSAARAQAFNEGDARGIAVHFTEDAILMPPGKPSMVGQEAVAAYYQAIFDEFETKLESGYEEVEVNGDLAYGRGIAKVWLTAKSDGTVTYAESEYINILKKQPDGSWKTTHDIWNSSQ